MTLQSILGNFALILFVLTIVTGVIWFYDHFVLAKRRRRLADETLRAFDARNAMLSAEGIRTQTQARDVMEANLLRQPAWIEYSGSFFPVIAMVFFLRSFLVEPFKIPSSSMVPTLLIGDLILVNKFTYGIRLPVINKKVIEVNQPQRGDVMVFKYPLDLSQDYIKRVVGVPGDVVEYRDKKLTVNGQAMTYVPLPDHLDAEKLTYLKQFQESLGHGHRMAVDENAAPVNLGSVMDFPSRDHCTYSETGFICKVPAGNYFMMGDNRDNSADSRYWGFVPDKNIVGKAFFVWMNLSNLKRIGGFE
jgi:signal peptidase I